MNAAVDDLIPPTTEDALVSAEASCAEAAAVRVEAAAKLDSAIAALDRAREVAAECQQAVDRLAAEEASWIKRSSRKLSDWIESGGRGNRPAAAADITVAQAQMTARVNAAAAAEALSHFEALERAAREALAAATVNEAAAGDAQQRAAAEVIAAEIEDHLAEIERLAAELRQFQPDDKYVPMNELRSQPVASLRVQRVLGKVDLLKGEFRVNVPLDELQRTGGIAA